MHNKKSQSIQVLRAFAFLLIFLSHWFECFSYWGAAGVSIFIVLSGYLETKRHLNDDINVRQFTLRKIRRFYPLHALTLILGLPFLVYAVYKGIQSFGKAIMVVILNLAVVQSWVPVSSVYFSLNGVAWYLCLVVFFALITPHLMVWFRKSSRKKIAAVVIMLILLDYALGIIADVLPTTANRIGVSHWISYVCPLARLSDYIMGGGMYVLLHEKAKTNRGILLMGLIAFISLLIAVINRHSGEISATAVWIVPSCMVVSGICERPSEMVGKCMRPFVFIGNISFELFLIHQIVIRYVKAVTEHIGIYRNWLVIPTFIVVVTVAFMYSRVDIFFRRNGK